MPFREHPLQFFAKNELKAREQQKYVLDQITENWDKYKYFFLSLPTGVGKTFIACSIADAVGKAYILTSSLQLQDQYQSSWDKIVNLKGRGNYECRINPAFMVDSAPCTADKSLIRECRQGKICDYYNQKDAALASQAMITNPVYFLYSTHCGFGSDEAIEENPWIKRDALIIDEAHNIEDHLASFAGAKIDPKELYETHGAKVGHFTFNGDLIHDYETCKEILVHLRAKAEEYAEKLEAEFPSNGSKSKEWARALTDKVAEKVKKLNTKIYALDKSIQPLNIFFGTHDTLDELNERWLMSANLEDNTLQLSPLRGGFLFKEYMGKMADKFIMLSATLGTKKELCAELDLNPDEVCFIETDTPFPAELSPIISQPKLKLGYKDLQSSLPKIAPLIEEVLDIHAGEKGIIHCATYKLQEEIFRRVNKKARDRILCRDMDVLESAMGGKNGYQRKYRNQELLQLHANNEKPNSVLMSPSMMEGVDLFDDLSAFQIILKMPWPSLGDPRIKRKTEINGDWYSNKVWVCIMQASGRSTRHEKDQSVTYILDASFPHFFKLWKHNLPTWFTDRVHFT
jgi:ATP-dependent DNA helicase DinG